MAPHKDSGSRALVREVTNLCVNGGLHAPDEEGQGWYHSCKGPRSFCSRFAKDISRQLSFAAHCKDCINESWAENSLKKGVARQCSKTGAQNTMTDHSGFLKPSKFGAWNFEQVPSLHGRCEDCYQGAYLYPKLMEPTVVPFSSCLKGHHLWDNAPGFVSKLKHSMAMVAHHFKSAICMSPFSDIQNGGSLGTNITSSISLSLSVRVHVLRCNVPSWYIYKRIQQNIA